jgi:catechol 2,3-dioxygenase-like lactoylglutathione lyase family enzyme
MDLTDPPALAGVHHVKLPVNDLDRSREWYRSRLGYEVTMEFVEQGTLMGYAMEHPNGGPQLGLRLDPGRARAAAGFDYFAIGVPGKAAIDELAARLTALGEDHAGVHLASIGWILPHLHDPDGHEVRFYTTEHHTASSQTMTTRTARDGILELASAHVPARALHVTADLGIADALAGASRTAEELAAAVDADADGLARLLRLLETYGVFARDDSGRWRHTQASGYLRGDHPQSLLSYARMSGTPFNWESVAHLDHAVRSGEPAIGQLDPDGWCSYLESHPGENDIFQQAMTAKAHADVAAVLATYDFSRHRRIADVGGGRGHLITAVLAAYPATNGVLFELPGTAGDVPPAERLDIAAGDFFTDPLPACDAYLLMNVIHDWDGKAATAILTAVADAGRPSDATVLLVEAILPGGSEPHRAKTLDVLMLAITGGRERTLSQYSGLLRGAGLELVRVTPTTTSFSIIEAQAR